MMNKRDKVKIEAGLFAFYCLLLAVCIPAFPLLTKLIFVLWIPCGFLNGFLVQRYMVKRYGPKDYFAGTHNLALFGLMLSGTVGFLIIPILFRTTGFKGIL